MPQQVQAALDALKRKSTAHTLTGMARYGIPSDNALGVAVGDIRALGTQAPFLQGLRLVEGAAADDRNFVKKGVNWALRAVGRRNPALHAAAVKLARRLAASTDATPRWVGKDALREITSPAVLKRLAVRRANATTKGAK